MGSILKKGVAMLNLAFNGKEVNSLAECIIDDALTLPAITDMLSIEQGIKAKQQIAYLERLYKITRKDAGCGGGFTDKQIKSREKFWLPQSVEIAFSQCYKDLEQTFFIWGTQNGIKKTDLRATDAMRFILEVLQSGAADDLQRQAWFADKDVEIVDDGGTLDDDLDVGDYDVYDGLWKQIFAIMTANPSQYVAITENSAVTATLQYTLANDRAVKVMDAMLKAADPRLFEQPTAPVFYLTNTLYQNYASYRRLQPNDESFLELGNGKRVLAFGGFEVKKYDLWDRTVKDFFDGTVYDLPHRATFSVKENFKLGVDSLAAVSEFEAEYRLKEKEVYVRGMYEADTKVVKDYLVVAAY